MKMFVIALSLALFFTSLGHAAGKGKASQMLLTAVEIANVEAIKFGYNVKHMAINVVDEKNNLKHEAINVDEKNTLWNEYISSGPILENHPTLRDKLNNRDFWAIYYAPKKRRLGGDLWIFVDKNTGEIIATDRGK